MISAVTTNFGTAESDRGMGAGHVRREIKGKSKGPKRRLRPLKSERPRLNLETLDLVPKRAVLALVGRPDLLLRDLAEFVDLGFDHDHAKRLEFRLCLDEIVDRLGE